MHLWEKIPPHARYAHMPLTSLWPISIVVAIVLQTGIYGECFTCNSSGEAGRLELRHLGSWKAGTPFQLPQLWIPFLLFHIDLKSMNPMLDHSSSAQTSRFLSPTMQKPYKAKNPFLPGKPREKNPTRKTYYKKLEFWACWLPDSLCGFLL